MNNLETLKYRQKLLLLVNTKEVFTTLIIVVVLLFYVESLKKNVAEICNNQFQQEILRMLDLDDREIKTAIKNDINSTDLVNFSTTNDSNWSKKIQPKSLKNKFDYIGTYSLNRKIINHSNRSKIHYKDFIPSKALEHIDKLGYAKFYLRTADGLLQVFGSTIKKENNKQLVGYLICARLIEQSFIQKMEKSTNSKITFLDYARNKEIEDNINYFEMNFKDYQGKTLGRVYFEKPFEKITVISFNTALVILISMFLLFVVNFFSVNAVFSDFLSPKRIISKTVNNQSISVLNDENVSFNGIGNLYDKIAEQQKELIKQKLIAKENEKLKSSFLENLSHEIRTPMNAIMGFTDLLMHTTVEKKEQLEYLAIIEKNGNNLVATIDNLIEMSKIELHQIKYNGTSVDLDSFMNDLHDSLKVGIKHSTSIDFKIINNKPPFFPIKTDVFKLKQIIINLVSNALKFTEKGSVILGYEIDDENSELKFTIEDTGFGIGEYEKAHIFDRFRRVNDDHSILVGGLGLGLAISKAYVEMIGGTISVDSKLGVGSKFYFTIPLEYTMMKDTVYHVVNQDPENKWSEKTILIAEDDNINFMLLQKIMKSKGYKIIRAQNGKEAVDICLNNPNIYLVLMDIRMPIMDGYEAFGKISSIKPNLPIIAQTAFSSEEDKEKIFKLGFHDFIAKPINRERLFELIEGVFHRKNYYC